MAIGDQDLPKRLDRARALNAIASINEGALSSESAPLLLVKDNIAVAGMPWTAGSGLFGDVIAKRDAAGVRLLRAAGANPAIKTTLHELAFGVTGANGWSGDIVNPHDPRRVAGGSSGGSAAALALGLGDLSLVTDTGGSARVPAAFCGVIGFRPSVGRYSSDGLIGLSPSRDTLGLMARTLAPIRWADDVLSGEDAPPGGPAGAITIGLPPADQLGEMEPAVAAALDRCANALTSAGYRVVTCDLSAANALDEECGFAIALHETGQSLMSSVPQLTGRGLPESLSSIATDEVRDLVELALGGAAVSSQAYGQAIGQGWPALQRTFAAVFDGGIDFILQPTAPLVAPVLGCGETVLLNGSVQPAFPTITRYTRPDSMAGLPSISLPAGCDDAGLPIGMMLTARKGSDARLLAFAEEAGKAFSQQG